MWCDSYVKTKINLFSTLIDVRIKISLLASSLNNNNNNSSNGNDPSNDDDKFTLIAPENSVEVVTSYFMMDSWA